MVDNSPSPMNLSIMKLDSNMLARVPRVLTPETYDGVSNKLHPEGLFSPIFFGAQGTQQRDYTFGHIKLFTSVMHPTICKWMKKVKRLHEDIWCGLKFAKFDKKLGEFIEATSEDGETGYHFFVSHMQEMKFKQTNSSKRKNIIKALERYRDRWMITELLVLPAGLRDIVIDEQGKTTEDEINEYYRKVLRTANALEGLPRTQASEMDQVRISLQKNINMIDEYIDTILSGKKGFLLGKWASRKLHLSSRNVISSQDPSTEDLDDPNRITIDSTIIGLFQLMVSIKPVIVSYMKRFPLIINAFPQASTFAYLVHPIKLTRTEVPCEDWQISQWTTNEGIEILIKKFEKESFRTMPAMINGHYIGLVYIDDKKYQILSDISELPEGWDKSKVRPLTYIEIFYLIGKDEYNKMMSQCTRYPVTGDESIFIADTMMIPTVSYFKLKEYVNGQWTEGYANAYPDINNPTYVSSASISPTRIKMVGGDYDGDKMSINPILSDEAIEENKALNDDIDKLFQPDGTPVYDVGTEIVERICLALTKDYHKDRLNRSTRS